MPLSCASSMAGWAARGWVAGRGDGQWILPYRQQLHAGRACHGADECCVQLAGADPRDPLGRWGADQPYPKTRRRLAQFFERAVQALAEPLAGAHPQDPIGSGRDVGGHLADPADCGEHSAGLGQQAFPAAVSRTWRDERSNSGTPSSRSSRRTCWLTAGCTMCSRSAARPKLSSSATAAK